MLIGSRYVCGLSQLWRVEVAQVDAQAIDANLGAIPTSMNKHALYPELVVFGADPVARVLFLRTNTKILAAVVGWIAIYVIHHHPFWVAHDLTVQPYKASRH